MLPKISQAPGVDLVVTEFLARLNREGFTGDSATAYADRLTMATDIAKRLKNDYSRCPDMWQRKHSWLLSK